MKTNMGAKKKRKDMEAEDEAGRGKRTKKPSTKYAMSAREEEIRLSMSPEAKVKPKSPESTKKKVAGEGGDELHPDACLVCRELKSKEDKQNKMIGKCSLNFTENELPTCFQAAMVVTSGSTGVVSA